MFTKAFWQAVAERAIKTAGQAGGLALIGVHLGSIGEVVTTAQAVGFGMLGGAAASILTSLASAKISGEPGPSLTNSEVLPPAGP